MSDTIPKQLAAVGALMISLTFMVNAQAAEPPQTSEGAAKVNSEAFAKLNDEGTVLFKARNFRNAAEKFIQAYALEQDPNLLFNIARCYDALEDWDSAIEKYREFLAKPGADAQGKQRAEEAIRTITKAKQQKMSSSSGEGTQSETASAPPQPSQSKMEPSETKEKAMGVWPWVTLGTGVAASAVGTVLYVMGTSDHNKVTEASGFGKPGEVVPMTEAEANKLVDSGKSNKTIGGVTLGIGGALLATSVVLFVIDGKGQSEGAVTVGAAASPQGGFISLRGRF